MGEIINTNTAIETQLGHFEALLSDWNAKDRDAPETAQNAVSDCHLKAKENDPNQVDGG